MKLLLTRFYDMQNELDERITKKFNLDPNSRDIYGKRVTALIVELSEMANSSRFFKFWTENPQPKDDLLEEYVDGLHFVLSIGNALGHQDEVPSFPSSPEIANIEPNQMFSVLMRIAVKMYGEDEYTYLLMAFLDMGFVLGFTWDEITGAYDKKNEVNHDRQDSGY